MFTKEKGIVSSEDRAIWKDIFGKEYESDEENEKYPEIPDNLNEDDSEEDILIVEKDSSDIIFTEAEDEDDKHEKETLNLCHGDHNLYMKIVKRNNQKLQPIARPEPRKIKQIPTVNAIAILSQNKSNIINSEPTLSLFTTLWTFLDDLLGHHSSVVNELKSFDSRSSAPVDFSSFEMENLVISDTKAGDRRGNHPDNLIVTKKSKKHIRVEISQSRIREKVQENEGPPTESTVSGAKESLPSLIMHDANIANPGAMNNSRNKLLRSMVERGVSAAEQLTGLFIGNTSNKLKGVEMEEYHRKKAYLIGELVQFRHYDPSVNAVTAVEWTMIGILLVDCLLRALNVIPNVGAIGRPGEFENWVTLLEEAFASLVLKYNHQYHENRASDKFVKGSVNNTGKVGTDFHNLQHTEISHLRNFFGTINN